MIIRWQMIAAGALAALAAGIPATAAEEDAQLWTALFANGAVSRESRVMVWFDGHARFREDFDRLGVSILRPGIGYRIGEAAALWAGYARIVSRSAGAPDVEENRLWSQATFPLGEIAGGRLTARSRLEQRFVEGADQAGWRARQFFRYEGPFDQTWSAVAYNEVFVNFNDTDFGARSGYDQNRLFAGVGFRPSKNLRLETGYLFNHVSREAAPDRINHALSLALFASL